MSSVDLMYSDYRQQWCIIYFKFPKGLDLNYSHYKNDIW